MFDIKDFYPSIKEYLLWQAIRFSKRQISITNKLTKKSFLYYNNKPWVKNGERNFDVTLSAYIGAEVSHLISIFMLSPLSKHIKESYWPA